MRTKQSMRQSTLIFQYFVKTRKKEKQTSFLNITVVKVVDLIKRKGDIPQKTASKTIDRRH